MDVLNLKCGQCGNINELPEGWNQPVAFCVKCGHKIHVPRPQDTPDDEKDDLQEDEEVGFAEQARKSEGKKISVTCPQCGKTVQVSARVAGRKARCKACDAPLDIPYPDDIEAVELPRPKHGAKETGLELVAPGEMPVAPPTETPDERDAMLDLLPEPIQDTVDDEGTHQPMPVVIPLTQQEIPPRKPPHAPHTPHRPQADIAADAAAEHAETQDLPDAQAAEDATQAAAVQTGQLASAVKDFQVGRKAVLARRRRAARMRSLAWIGGIILACAVLAVSAGIFWPVLFPKQQQFVDITDDPTPGPSNPPVGNGQQTPARPTTGNAIAAAGNHTNSHTRPVAPPPPASPKCDVVELVTRTFGPGGYYPAALGTIYWKLTADLTAGEEPIEFQARGKDVQLVFAGKPVDSLGVPVDSQASTALLPTMARQETIALKPKQHRRITLLFEVPTGIAEGELVIGKLKWPFKMVQGPAAIPPANLAGTFVEAPPRNLQPMLDNPVMAAIQAAGQQHLAVRAKGEGLEVTIPEAQVRGQASPAGRDVYALALTRGDSKLAANLRFTEGGRTAILYLDAKPFHQITYINPAISSPAPPRYKTPTSPAPKPAPTRTKPAPRQVYTPPKPLPRPKDPTHLPTGPSIFD